MRVRGRQVCRAHLYTVVWPLGYLFLLAGQSSKYARLPSAVFFVARCRVHHVLLHHTTAIGSGSILGCGPMRTRTGGAGDSRVCYIVFRTAHRSFCWFILWFSLPPQCETAISRRLGTLQAVVHVRSVWCWLWYTKMATMLQREAPPPPPPTGCWQLLVRFGTTKRAAPTRKY